MNAFRTPAASRPTRADPIRRAVPRANSTPDDVNHVRDYLPANGARTPGVDATVRKPGLAGTGKLWQKQQELHGAPLWPLRQSANRIGIRPALARPVVCHRASGYEDMPRRTVPLMQLRLEGASVASPHRTAAVATGNALPRSTARQWQGIWSGLALSLAGFSPLAR